MILLSRLSFKAYNFWNSFWSYSISKFIIPSINIVIFYNIGRLTNNVSTSFVLNSVLIVMISIIITDSIIFIQSEKRFHTLTPILITPINKLKLYISRVTINYIHGLVLTVFYFIVVSLIFSVSFPNGRLLYAILHIIALSISLLTLSMFVGFLSILVEEVTLITMLLYNILIITSGIFGNVNILYLEWLTPIKFYTNNIDTIIKGGTIQLTDYLPYLYYLIIYIVVFSILVKPIEKLIYIHGAKEE